MKGFIRIRNERATAATPTAMLPSILARHVTAVVADGKRAAGRLGSASLQLAKFLGHLCAALAEPDARHRLGSWELHASARARELVERNQQEPG